MESFFHLQTRLARTEDDSIFFDALYVFEQQECLLMFTINA